MTNNQMKMVVKRVMGIKLGVNVKTSNIVFLESGDSPVDFRIVFSMEQLRTNVGFSVEYEITGKTQESIKEVELRIKNNLGVGSFVDDSLYI